MKIFLFVWTIKQRVLGKSIRAKTELNRMDQAIQRIQHNQHIHLLKTDYLEP